MSASDSSATGLICNKVTLLMLPVLFNHSACKLSLFVHESPVCLLRDIFFFLPSVILLLSPPSALTQKSILVHSLCQHLPTSALFPPSFSSSLLDILCCAHAVCLWISTPQDTLQLCIELVGPSVECFESVILYFYEVILTFRYCS